MPLDDIIATRLVDLANTTQSDEAASLRTVERIAGQKRRRRSQLTAVALCSFLAVAVLVGAMAARSRRSDLEVTTPGPPGATPRQVLVPHWMPDGFSIQTNVLVAPLAVEASIGALPLSQVLIAGNGAKSAAAADVVLVTQTEPGAVGDEESRGDHSVDLNGLAARAGSTSEGTGVLLRFLWWRQDDVVVFLGGYRLSEDDLIHMAKELTPTSAATEDQKLTIEPSRPTPCGPIVEGPGPPSHTINADALPGKGYTSLENTLANQLQGWARSVGAPTGTGTTVPWLTDPWWIDVVPRHGNVYQDGPNGSLVVGPTPDDWELAVLVASAAQFPATGIDKPIIPIRYFACAQ